MIFRFVRSGGAVVFGLIASFALSASAATRGNPSTGVAERAIVRFDSSPSGFDRSVYAVNVVAFDHPAMLRAAALKHLSDRKPGVRFASVYALALTADAKSGAVQLRALLHSRVVEDRLLAAGALASLGDTQALPVLIAALGNPSPFAFWNSPLQAFAFAQTELLRVTDKDFGLKQAGTAAQVGATKPAWKRWWRKSGASVRFDPARGRFLG